MPDLEHITYLLQHRYNKLNKQEINILSNFVELLKKAMEVEIDKEYITTEEKKEREGFIREIEAIIKENQTRLL